MLQSEKHEFACQFSLSILQIDTRTLEFDSVQHNLVPVENPFVYVRIGTMNEISKGRGLKKKKGTRSIFCDLCSICNSVNTLIHLPSHCHKKWSEKKKSGFFSD